MFWVLGAAGQDLATDHQERGRDNLFLKRASGCHDHTLNRCRCLREARDDTNRQDQRGVVLMTPKLESLATYIAALIVIKNELSSEAEIRDELSQAIEAFQKELQTARKRRAA